VISHYLVGAVVVVVVIVW